MGEGTRAQNTAGNQTQLVLGPLRLSKQMKDVFLTGY